MEKPKMSGDGFYYTADGRKLCEECWHVIPRYVDFPQGLTSPESEIDASGSYAKKRMTSIEGKPAVEPLRKAVCLACYFKLFEATNPGVELPELSNMVLPDAHAYTPEPTIESPFVPEPKSI
jgi:hypothetical protein